MSKIELKKATIEDIPALITIENKLTNLRTFSAMTSEKEWQDEFSNGNVTVYLVLKDGIIVGDASYEKKPDGSFYLSGLAIDPQFQRQGIGREVMNSIMDELKDIKVIKLLTHPENSVAVKLYLSFGFVIKSRKENYFGDGEPRIEMIKENSDKEIPAGSLLK